MDTGAVADNTFNEMLDEGAIEEGKLEIGHEPEAIPESPITVREGSRRR